MLRQPTVLFACWGVAGALLGIAAARRNGFNISGGLLGGLLLGPLAALMFMVDGAADEGAGQSKCPYCSQWVKGGAVRCQHCRRTLRRTATDVSRSGRCRKCSGSVPRLAKTCPHCESAIRTDQRNVTVRPVRVEAFNEPLLVYHSSHDNPGRLR